MLRIRCGWVICGGIGFPIRSIVSGNDADIILIRVKTGNPKGSLVVRSDNRLRDRHHSVEDE